MGPGYGIDGDEHHYHMWLPPTYSGVHLGMKPTEIGPGRSALTMGRWGGGVLTPRETCAEIRRRVVEPDSNRRGEVGRGGGRQQMGGTSS